MKITIFGLTISSSWGNGHATTYRGLVREVVRRGHDVLFLERDVPWYAGAHRDLSDPDFCRLEYYRTLADLDGMGYETWTDLRRYCMQVAGSVGMTMCHLLNAPEPAAKKPQGQADHAGAMGKHAFNSHMGLARIGRSQNGCNAF